MAMTINSRNVRRRNANNKRSIEFDLTFSDGAAGTITKAQSGLKKVNEVWVKAKASGGTGIDLTTNTDNVSVVLDPVAAISNVIVVLIGTE